MTSTCFKISSGREIQGLDLTASIVSSQWCGINISPWPRALRSMQRMFISWYYKIELPGLQWCGQAPHFGLEPCVPCRGCFASWYYKIKPYKGRVIWLHMVLGNGVHQTKFDSIHYAEFLLLLLRGQRKRGKLFLFGMSYHDSINNEKNSCLIIMVGINSMLRNSNCGIRLSLHLVQYVFRVSYYMVMDAKYNVPVIMFIVSK